MQVSEHASWSSKYYGRIISAALAAVGEAWLPAASIYTAQGLRLTAVNEMHCQIASVYSHRPALVSALSGAADALSA